MTNLWGWTPKGVWTWIRLGWAKPIAVWGIEHRPKTPRRPSNQRVYLRRVKIGPFSFAAGVYRTRGPI